MIFNTHVLVLRRAHRQIYFHTHLLAIQRYQTRLYQRAMLLHVYMPACMECGVLNETITSSSLVSDIQSFARLL